MNEQKISPQALFEKLSKIKVDNPLCKYTLQRCESISPIINEINRLKVEKQAVILAHSYVHPDIIYGVADYVGDSYYLAKKAMETDAKTIVFPAVRFMAETAKILNPDKLVIDPNPNGGCSLADSVTKKDVLALRKKYPSHTFVCYINTTAAVKSVCDVCVTSSNVFSIIQKIENDKIVFLPDLLMGKNLVNEMKEKGLHKEIVLYDGSCYVHEEFSASQLDALKKENPDMLTLVHPECDEDVVAQADMVGSTSQILSFAKEQTRPMAILTECGITSRLQIESPELNIIGSCMMCKYMKSNSLSDILQALKDPKSNMIVDIDPALLQAAKRNIDEMFRYVNL